MTLALFKGDSVSFCISGSSKSYKLPQLGYLLLRADKSSKNCTLYKSRETLVLGGASSSFCFSKKLEKLEISSHEQGSFFKLTKAAFCTKSRETPSEQLPKLFQKVLLEKLHLTITSS